MDCEIRRGRVRGAGEQRARSQTLIDLLAPVDQKCAPAFVSTRTGRDFRPAGCTKRLGRREPASEQRQPAGRPGKLFGGQKWPRQKDINFCWSTKSKMLLSRRCHLVGLTWFAPAARRFWRGGGGGGQTRLGRHLDQSEAGALATNKERLCRTRKAACEPDKASC